MSIQTDLAAVEEAAMARMGLIKTILLIVVAVVILAVAIGSVRSMFKRPPAQTAADVAFDVERAHALQLEQAAAEKTIALLAADAERQKREEAERKLGLAQDAVRKLTAETEAGKRQCFDPKAWRATQ
jgi:flagellar basal body-associated protein FliL